jgi:hypothetical protein
LRAGAVAVVLGLGLSGCGAAAEDGDERADDVVVDERSGEGDVVIQDALASAAVSTLDAGSARMSMRMTMAGAGVPEGAVITADGVMDFESGAVSMTMDMGPLLAMMEPSEAGDVPGDLTVEMRMVDYVMYMRFPESLRGEAGGLPTPWVSIDLRSSLDDMGLSEDLLDQYAQNDPTQYLQYLGAVSSGVEEVGRERVRDVDTTHYRAAIDLTKAIDQVPQEVKDRLGLDRDALAETFEEMQTQFGISELPTEAWIDDDGLLRRMRIEMGAAGVGMKVEMDLFDYGVAVDVVAPPAGEVTDLLSMLGGLGA